MKPDFILCGDLHLREDQPVCRLDEYWEAQARKIAWLADLQRKHGCPILDSGDLFHKWKPSPFLLQWAIKNLPDHIISVPGNHDLPAHNLDLYDKCGLGVLEAAKKVEVHREPYLLNRIVDVTPFAWGEELHDNLPNHFPQVAVCHLMTYVGRTPFPGCKDPGAPSLLRKLSGYDLILTGHNHRPFVIEDEGRVLVNPGSLMRATADQADHEPRVYLAYIDQRKNRITVEPVFVPIEKDVVSRDHLDSVEARDERISAFVTRLTEEFEVSLSFRGNLENFFATHRVRGGVSKLVWAAVDGTE